MVNGLSIAEQYVDLQARTEMFRGRQIELVTGQVVLHALDDHGQPLCGHDIGRLTPTGHPWHAGYLPHLPRCHGCLSRAAGAPAPGLPGHDSGPPGRVAQPSGADIRTAHGTEGENAAAAALRAVLDGHDLRRWMFTDLVSIDEAIRGGLSHPLTISPRLLVQQPSSGSMPATPGSTARSSTIPAGSQASCTGTASECPSSPRSHAAWSVSRCGPATADRRYRRWRC